MNHSKTAFCLLVSVIMLIVHLWYIFENIFIIKCIHFCMHLSMHLLNVPMIYYTWL